MADMDVDTTPATTETTAPATVAPVKLDQFMIDILMTIVSERELHKTEIQRLNKAVQDHVNAANAAQEKIMAYLNQSCVSLGLTVDDRQFDDPTLSFVAKGKSKG